MNFAFLLVYSRKLAHCCIFFAIKSLPFIISEENKFTLSLFSFISEPECVKDRKYQALLREFPGNVIKVKFSMKMQEKNRMNWRICKVFQQDV